MQAMLLLYPALVILILVAAVYGARKRSRRASASRRPTAEASVGPISRDSSGNRHETADGNRMVAPPSAYKLHTVGDYLRFVGMRVSLGTRCDESFDGVVDDLSDSGTHLILREVTHQPKNGPAKQYDRKNIRISEIDFVEILDRHAAKASNVSSEDAGQPRRRAMEVADLIKALSDQDKQIRHKAISELNKYPGDAAVKALLDALRDTDAEIRAHAAESLRVMAVRGARNISVDPILEALRAEPENSSAHYYIMEALRQLGAGLAADMLIEQKKQEQVADVLAGGGSGADKIQQMREAARIQQAGGDKATWVRASDRHQENLNNTGGDAREAFDVLFAALQDKDPEVRAEASRLLEESVQSLTKLAVLYRRCQGLDPRRASLAGRVLGRKIGKGLGDDILPEVSKPYYGVAICFLPCPCYHCGRQNRWIAAPPNALEIPYYHQDKEGGAHAVPVLCDTCSKEFFVVWDSDPRPRGWPASERDCLDELTGELERDIETGLDNDIEGRSVQAALALAEFGDLAVGPLTALLSVSRFAHLALGFVGGEAASQVLVQELRHNNWRRAAAAATALGQLGDQRTLALLRSRLGETTSSEVYSAITTAIALLEANQHAREELPRSSPGQQTAQPPSSRAAEAFKEALVLVERTQLRDAIDAFASIPSDAPEYRAARFNQAVLLARTGFLPDAIARLECLAGAEDPDVQKALADCAKARSRGGGVVACDDVPLKTPPATPSSSAAPGIPEQTLKTAGPLPSEQAAFPDPQDQISVFRQRLLSITGGDGRKVEWLISFERQRSADADEATLLRFAIARWERDNRSWR